METENFEKRRSSDVTIDLVARNLTEMRIDMRDMRKDVIDGMNKVAEAMNTLAKIEERQSSTNRVIDELKSELKSQEVRIDSIEKSQPEIQRVINWIYSALSFVAVGVGTALGKYFGLF